jgi:hypothetical protein
MKKRIERLENELRQTKRIALIAAACALIALCTSCQIERLVIA